MCNFRCARNIIRIVSWRLNERNTAGKPEFQNCIGAFQALPRLERERECVCSAGRFVTPWHDDLRASSIIMNSISGLCHHSTLFTATVGVASFTTFTVCLRYIRLIHCHIFTRHALDLQPLISFISNVLRCFCILGVQFWRFDSAITRIASNFASSANEWAQGFTVSMLRCLMTTYSYVQLEKSSKVFSSDVSLCVLVFGHDCRMPKLMRRISYLHAFCLLSLWIIWNRNS